MPNEAPTFSHPMTDKKGRYNNSIADKINLKNDNDPRQMTIANAVAGKQYTGDIGNAYREVEAAEATEVEEPVVGG